MKTLDEKQQAREAKAASAFRATVAAAVGNGLCEEVAWMLHRHAELRVDSRVVAPALLRRIDNARRQLTAALAELEELAMWLRHAP